MRLLDEMFVPVSDDGRQMVLRLNAAHPIYQLHFPNHPITPGVCLVQMALELMGCSLLGAKDIKFVQPVLPDAELRLEWIVQDGRADISFFLEPAGDLCAKMTLSV